jgi:hypothetical protein
MRSLRYKPLIIISLAFFIVVNTQYFWETELGFGLIMIVYPALLILFITLFISLISQIYKAIRQKFKDKQQNIFILGISLVLGLTIFRPVGLIDFESFDGKTMLLAEGREGAAHCKTVLELKENKKFREREVCFGIKRCSGYYSYSKDTVQFQADELRMNGEAFSFGVIKSEVHILTKAEGTLFLYRNMSDTMPQMLSINKNELK